MKASYLELVNRFWAENRQSQFSPCQTALYFFLLSEANAVKWKMPVSVPTAVACQLTSMGKSSLVRAREALRKRGLIEFSLGAARKTSPTYFICDTNGDTKDDTMGGTKSDTKSGTKRDTNGGTIIKDIDIDKTKTISTNNIACEEKIDFEELEKSLSDDAEWLESVIEAAGRDKVADIDAARSHLSQFFRYLKASGSERKGKAEAKSHFFNWLMKQLKSPTKNQSYVSNRPQRKNLAPMGDGQAHGASSYHEPF